MAARSTVVLKGARTEAETRQQANEIIQRETSDVNVVVSVEVTSRGEILKAEPSLLINEVFSMTEMEQ